MSPLPSAPAPALDGAVHLADWGVIRATGADARSFLNSQLTQETLSLGEHEARLAGWCSAKGRLMASFVVWARGPEELLLACSADLLAPTLKRLSMFVLRAKCKLSDASAELAVYGLAGAAALDAVAGAAPLSRRAAGADGAADAVRLPDGAGIARALWVGAGPPPAAAALDAEAWRWLEVQAAVPRVVAATAEQFVPQMVNLELVGGVNFKKGCYPGQEVVARSQYRGTLKRRAFRFEAAAPAAPGQELFAASDPGQPAGMVVLSAPVPGAPGRHALLAETKIALAAEPLHLGAPDGPLLAPRGLPYEIPAEAA